MRETIRRIKTMELYFDIVKQAYEINPSIASVDEHVKSMLKALTDYYESGQWQADYEADERGELPCDLKRGVLGQDALWNFLESIKA